MRPIFIPIGTRYGMLVVIGPREVFTKAGKTNSWYLCQCDCGSETRALAHCLTSGHKRSCGCMRTRPIDGVKKTYRLSISLGSRFGKLTVIGERQIVPYGTAQAGHSSYPCRCDCGREILANASGLLNGNQKSCGCLKMSSGPNCQHYKHGYISRDYPHRRLYNIWLKMHARCYAVNHDSYADYGGRGIFVCSEWHDYETFLEWALSSGYAEKLTIDRIDNDGPYVAGNCRWSTTIVQSRNTRRNVFISAWGETKCLADWVSDSRCSVCGNTISKRIRDGMMPEDAISTAPRRAKSRGAHACDSPPTHESGPETGDPALKS